MKGEQERQPSLSKKSASLHCNDDDDERRERIWVCVYMCESESITTREQPQFQPGVLSYTFARERERNEMVVCRLRSTRGLVNFERVDGPVGIAHVWVVAKVSLAGTLTGHSLTRLGLAVHGVAPDGAGAGPVTADSVGENDDVVVEVVANVALSSGPVCLGLTPVGRVRRARADVVGNVALAEEVDRDAIGLGPVHDVDATAVLVVANTKVVTLGGCDTATLIAGSVGSTVVGTVVLEGELARHVGIAGDSAAAGGVDRVGVERVVVNTLDDVDLTSVGPATRRVSGGGPPSGPDTTSNGHVLGIEDKDTGGEGVLGVDTDGLGPAVVGGDLHGSLAVVAANETLVIGLVLADVGDGAVGGVSAGEEVHVVKEGGAGVRLDQLPLGSGGGR